MFDKQYKNRKDKRKRYYGAKSFDRSCRNHGSCPYCKDSRLHSSRKRLEQSEINNDDLIIYTGQEYQINSIIREIEHGNI